MLCRAIRSVRRPISIASTTRSSSSTSTMMSAASAVIPPAVRGERDADVGGRERRRIVHPIAYHHDYIPAGTHPFDETRLVGREQVAMRLLDPDLRGERARDRRVVARQQHDATDAVVGEPLQNARQFRPNGIGILDHGGEAIVDRDVGAQGAGRVFERFRRDLALLARRQDEGPGADAHVVTFDDAVDSLPRCLDLPSAGRKRVRLASHRVDEHSCQEVARAFLDGGRISHHRRAIEAWRNSHRGEAGFPDGQRSCLVEHRGGDCGKFSSAPPRRMITKRFAARLMPPMMATGVARINGQGVATTRIANARIQSWSPKPRSHRRRP